MTSAKSCVTQFDSSSSMLYALGGCLRGRGFSGAGVATNVPEWPVKLLNLLPVSMRQTIYSFGGWWEALPSARLKKIDAEEIAGWAVGQYPARKYPAVMLGSSNGAAIHLAAALGIPWLPQTCLVASRRLLHPDDLSRDVEWGKGPARLIAEKNPELQINQMHDPLQDRLMVSTMAYFRLKRLALGKAYKKFLENSLAEGGDLIFVECEFPWPMMRVSEKHFFQVGGFGGLKGREYFEGSGRVADFLKKHRSPKKRWEPPGELEEHPESEWGFLRELRLDAERLAKKHGWKILRIVFTDPDALSPFIADLHRWWYARQGVPFERLVAECFALIEPWQCLATASVPFWLTFHTECSARELERYLDGASFDEVYLMLMQNGVDGIGCVPIERWKSILSRAKKRGEFLGVDEKKYPMDFGAFIRYHTEMKKKISERHPLPALQLGELDEFRRQAAGRHAVECLF